MATLAVVAVAGGRAFALRWAPDTAAYRFQGVDVAEQQGAIDWPVVRAEGADFAYLRATYGAAGRDTAFEQHWRAVAEAGMRRGAYLAYSLCQPAVAQANNFNIVVPRADDALPPAVQVDFDPACPARPARAALIADLARLMATIENHSGRPALLKLSREVEAHYRLSAALPRSIWAVGNYFPPDYPARPWRLWQANDRRRIDGIDQPVHWNVVAP